MIVRSPEDKMIGVGNPVLYRSKKEIDRHVQEQFAKINSEHEVRICIPVNRWLFRIASDGRRRSIIPRAAFAA